jgi:hypothetical protein
MHGLQWGYFLILATTWELGYNALHYKHAHVFLKVNKLFKRLNITVDAQNVSILLLNTFQVYWKIIWHLLQFTDLNRCNWFTNTLSSSSVGIIWIHFVLLSKQVWRMLLTYHSELIVFKKNIVPAIHVTVMAHYTPMFCSWRGTSKAGLGFMLLQYLLFWAAI